MPSTVTVPLVGWSSAPISDSSDVLPDPEGPVSATNSPGSSVSETSATATTGPGWTRDTASTSTRAPSCSAMDLDRIVEMHAALPAHAQDHAQDQRDADRPARPGERRVAEAAGERVGRMTARPRLRAGRVGVGLRARIARGDDLTVVDELVRRG